MSTWQRLSPRMLLVHPVHEILRQIPVLVGSIVLGSATGNQAWPLAALGLTVAFGLARWFTTTYRIDTDNVALRTGVLHRRLLSVPRNRVRSVETDARLLHRLLGLTVLRVGTGRDVAGETKFELDAVESQRVPHLRAMLLAESVPATTEPAGRVLARWSPSWLRYSPLSFSGLVMIVAAVGLAYQSGFGVTLQRSGVAVVQRSGVVVVAVMAGVVLVLLSVLLAVGFSLVTYGNLLLRRDAGPTGDVLHLRHGLLRVREHTFDMRRLRGGTVREPLAVRAMGGARLDAVMTGVRGEGESSLLLPPCPSATAQAVLADLVDDPDAAAGPLRRHGPVAKRRRWTRALALPLLAGAALVIGAVTVGVPVWVWPVWAAVTACCGLLAVDRSGSLGHRIAGGWLVTRMGSLERRRHCLNCAGIIAWTVRQTLPQRRAGVATLVAATAAGRKRYEVVDVPAELAWTIAAEASPWVANSVWARRHPDNGNAITGSAAPLRT